MEDLQECISRCMLLSIADMPSCSVVCAQYLRTPQRRHSSFGEGLLSPSSDPCRARSMSPQHGPSWEFNSGPAAGGMTSASRQFRAYREQPIKSLLEVI